MVVEVRRDGCTTILIRGLIDRRAYRAETTRVNLGSCLNLYRVVDFH